MKINLKNSEVPYWLLGDVIQNAQGIYMVIYFNDEYHMLDIKDGIAFGEADDLSDLYQRYHQPNERKINAELVEANEPQHLTVADVLNGEAENNG